MTELAIEQTYESKSKYRKLLLCVFLDAIGYLSFLVPFLGEFTDVIWAPISASLLAKMFKGTIGKVGGIFAFFEEILPGLDFIPTFTITWIYSNFIKR